MLKKEIRFSTDKVLKSRNKSWQICKTFYTRGGQTTARRAHVAREGILCGSQGSHTYIDSTYLESMLK